MRELDLDTITLKSGKHNSPDDGGCIMEFASYLAGEPWSDHPECVSPVIGAFCRSWNDPLNDTDRNRLLKPFLTKVIGTNTGPEDDETRAWLALDWSIRTSTPTWLRLAGLDTEADALSTLDPITDHATLALATPALTAAKAAGAAAGDAAWDAAGAAAGAAARDAAAGAAAWDAARDAARDAAGAAAWDAAGAAAGAAAWDAARDALAPTVAELQTSAADLLDRMIAVGQ